MLNLSVAVEELESARAEHLGPADENETVDQEVGLLTPGTCWAEKEKLWHKSRVRHGIFEVQEFNIQTTESLSE